MSMTTAIYAEYAEGMRKRWLDKLGEALKSKDWGAVEKLYTEIDSYMFTE